MSRNLETALERLRRTLDDVPAEVMERRLREAEALEAGRCEKAPRRKRKKKALAGARGCNRLSVDGVDKVDRPGGCARRRREGDGIERGREWVPEEDWRRGYWDEERLEAAGFR